MKYILFSICYASIFNCSTIIPVLSVISNPEGSSTPLPLPPCSPSLLERRTKLCVAPPHYFEIWVAYGASQEREMQILLTAVFTSPASSLYRWFTNAAAGLGRSKAWPVGCLGWVGWCVVCSCNKAEIGLGNFGDIWKPWFSVESSCAQMNPLDEFHPPFWKRENLKLKRHSVWRLKTDFLGQCISLKM